MKLTGRWLPMALCVAAVLAFAPGISNAAIIQTWTFTSDHCGGTGGCLTGQTNGGTVTVTDNGTGTLVFDIALANGNYFVGGGFDAAFGFNLTGITSITYSGISPLGGSTGFIDPSPQTSGSLHMDGTGFFQFGLECGASGASSGGCGSSLTFTIAATGLDITDISANALGQIFAADIFSGTTGNTGGIDVSSSGPSSSGPSSSGPGLPEPGTLFLLGIAIVGLGVFRRKAPHLRTGSPS